ncbi:50S ribosomal protein L22 [Candidatus Woesearchaeota archaeon]|nr:50S ribosomal protein L22 [Candidatus Woesearchaeota archaeon]
MAGYNYAFQNFNKELMARAVGRDLGISTKQSIEICNYLRHRKLDQAKRLLEEVIVKKRAIPFKRFTNGLGHRSGKIASGRYPIKSCAAILKLLESAEANAQTKGLNTGELEIVHICSHRASQPVHYGRNYGREFKKTHVEVVVQETVAKKKGEKQGKEAAPQKEHAPKEKPAQKAQINEGKEDKK